MARRSQRRLTIGDDVFLWTMSWSYDLDGERIIDLTVRHAAAEGDGPRPRGVLRVRFVGRHSVYPEDTSVALPADVRAAIDRARELGWSGARTFWLLPAAGLERPTLVVLPATRLREWANGAALFTLWVDDGSIAGRLADALEAPPVPEARDGAEAQWRSARWFVLRGRDGGRSTTVHARSAADLAIALAAASRVAPAAGLSLRAHGAKIVGPGAGEIPPHEVTPPSSWAEIPGAIRHRGPREVDVIWTIPTAEGAQIESYHHHAEAPDRLWIWLSIRAESAIERRFRLFQ